MSLVNNTIIGTGESTTSIPGEVGVSSIVTSYLGLGSKMSDVIGYPAVIAPVLNQVWASGFQQTVSWSTAYLSAPVSQE